MKNSLFFQSYVDVRANLICRLMHRQDMARMKGTVFARAFGDLAVIPCIYQRSGDGTAVSCPVSLLLAEKWQISEEKLLEDALHNMETMLPPRLYRLDVLMKSPITGSVRNVLLGLLRKQFKDAGEAVLDQVAQALTVRLEQKFQAESGLRPMWVLGNEAWMYGATSLLFPRVLEEFSEKIEGNFFILPSSIHEVILLPEGGKESRNQLYEMVASANLRMADKTKILSGSVYYFDKNRTEIQTL